MLQFLTKAFRAPAEPGTLVAGAAQVLDTSPSHTVGLDILRRRSTDRIQVLHGSLPSPHAIEGQETWATPFQWLEWLEAWQHNPDSRSKSIPITVTHCIDRRPAVVLPLAISRKFGLRCITWHAYRNSDYCAPLLNRRQLGRIAQLDGASLLRDIARRVGNVDLIYLPKQPATIDGVRNPFVIEGSVPYHAGAHAINFEAGEAFEELLQRRRSSKTRRRLKEKRAALEKLGAVTFRLATSPNEARPLIEACLAAKSSQLSKLGHWDPFSPTGVRDTIVDYFSRHISKSTWTAALNVAGRPVAIGFGFKDEREWLLYQMAMPEGPELRHSPGTHLLMCLMKHCCDIGVRRLDLALGDEPYKSEWCDEHNSLHVSLLPISLRGRLLYLALQFRAALRAQLVADPRIYKHAKWLKGAAMKLHPKHWAE